MDHFTLDNLSQLSQAAPTVIRLLLILTRVSGMMLGSPFFSAHSIPNQAKIGISVLLSILLFSLHGSPTDYVAPINAIQFAVMAVQEFVIGLLIGFAAELLFTGVRMAGEYLAVQMGMSISGSLDPLSGVNTPVIGQFYFIFAFLLFLKLNLHHALIVGVDRSFQWLPLGGGLPNIQLLAAKFAHLGGDMFRVALMVAMPVMGILLILEIAMAFVAKVMPQMNIFIVGLPLKSALGMVALMASLPFLASFLSSQYADLVQHLFGLYRGNA